MVFEAGLFGGVLGMRRTFILHANGAKLPTDLLGLTCVRYAETTPAEIKEINQKLRNAIETEGRLAKIEGLWWQHSLTARTEEEPSAVSLLRISRDRQGGLQLTGAAWQEDGTLSVALPERGGEGAARPVRHLLLLERRAAAAPGRAAARGHRRRSGSSRSTGPPATGSPGRPPTRLLNIRTSGVYLRAEPEDAEVMDGNDQQGRAALIAEKLEEWRLIANS